MRKGRKFNILKSHLNYDNDPISNEGGMAEVGSSTRRYFKYNCNLLTAQLETCLAKKFKSLSLSNEGENNMPSTSMLKKSIEEPCVDVRCVISRISIRITAF